jgi:hypothetical protein
MFAEIREYLRAVWTSWIALMSGVFALIAWIVTAAVEPMPVSMRWLLLILGAIAVLVGGYVVWREEYRRRLTIPIRLSIKRLADEGERLAKGCQVAKGAGDTLNVVATTQQWHRHVMEMVKGRELFPYWMHFNDFNELYPENSPNARGMSYPEQVLALVQRLRDVLDIIGPGRQAE